jgi:hypothetical protein
MTERLSLAPLVAAVLIWSLAIAQGQYEFSPRTIDLIEAAAEQRRPRFLHLTSREKAAGPAFPASARSTSLVGISMNAGYRETFETTDEFGRIKFRETTGSKN